MTFKFLLERNVSVSPFMHFSPFMTKPEDRRAHCFTRGHRAARRCSRRQFAVGSWYRDVGRTALAAARQAARFFDPDLIILDLMMPEMDGSELAASFKEDRLLRDVPVLFMTALVDPAECGTRGGQTYLSKNVPVDRLIACIEEKLHAAAAAASSAVGS